MTEEAKRELAQCDQRIEWILKNDGTSAWLKEALESAAACDPVSILNDVEILCELLKRRSAARVRFALNWSGESVDEVIRTAVQSDKAQ